MMKSILYCWVVLALAGAYILPAQSTQPVPAAHSASHAALLDINTATPEQMLALPGMGRAYVQRVIAGRPYTAKNQLVSRGILPEAAYEKIAPQIVAKRIPRF